MMHALDRTNAILVLLIITTLVVPSTYGQAIDKTDANDLCKEVPTPNTNNDMLCVDLRGCCTFKTIQSAVDAAPRLSQTPIVIWVNSGFYFEKVIIPADKPNLIFQGQGYLNTMIAWNDTAKKTGTVDSASVGVLSSDFVARNISFKNLAPAAQPGEKGGQAVAIRVAGDKATFWGCGFYGAQDTLLDERGRHYYKDCYIEGSIDFIFGQGKSIFEDCTLYSRAQPQEGITGVVTAHGRESEDEDSGFVFYKCVINGTGTIDLGRAWRPYSRVIFAHTFMTNVVSTRGWDDWNNVMNDRTVFYGEYNNFGPGADMSQRVAYARKLDDNEAESFIQLSYIQADQWLNRNFSFPKDTDTKSPKKEIERTGETPPSNINLKPNRSLPLPPSNTPFSPYGSPEMGHLLVLSLANHPVQLSVILYLSFLLAGFGP